MACAVKDASMSSWVISGRGMPSGPSAASAFRKIAICRSAVRGQFGPCAGAWVMRAVKTMTSVALTSARTVPSVRPRARKASRKR